MEDEVPGDVEDQDILQPADEPHALGLILQHIDHVLHQNEAVLQQNAALLQHAQAMPRWPFELPQLLPRLPYQPWYAIPRTPTLLPAPRPAIEDTTPLERSSKRRKL